MTELRLSVELYDDDTPSIHAMRTPEYGYSHWLPELHEAVAAAIREYPNMDAEWWLAPSAVLGVVESWLLNHGTIAPGRPTEDPT